MNAHFVCHLKQFVVIRDQTTGRQWALNDLLLQKQFASTLCPHVWIRNRPPEMILFYPSYAGKIIKYVQSNKISFEQAK